MKIAVMLRHINDKGGITVYTINILKHLFELDKSNEYHLLYHEPGTNNGLFSFPNVKNVHLRSCTRIFWDQSAVAKYAEKEKIDIIFNPKLSVPLSAGCKTVFTMHGLEQFAAKQVFKFFDRMYFSSAMPLYCNKADAILVMTETGKMDLMKYLSVKENKIRIIPESYNESCRRIEEPSTLKAVRTKYSLPEKYILFVGGITPLKNISNLLKAYSLLREKGLPQSIVLAGFKRWRFDEDMALISRLNDSKCIVDPGFIDDSDLPALYSMADCFVLPSLYEGFGIPILEAQACGCPVACSKTGAMPEVGGKGVVTFNPFSHADIAAKLENILTSPELRLSQIKAGYENITKYSWKKTAQQTLDVFNQLII